MEGREPLTPDDPDDWFAYETTSAAGDPDAGWIDDEPVTDRLRRTRLTPLTAVIIAAAVVLMVVIGLAVGGVFSGGGNTTVTTTTLQTTPTTNRTPTTPKRPAVAAPSSTLKPGDSGTQVKVLQRALQKLGYSVGKVDGDYGPSTQTALKQFQTKAKLTADGVLGPATLRALKRALAAQS